MKVEKTESPKKLRIVVTKNDIRRGIRSSPYRCPIALSIKRTTGSRYISVADYGFDLDFECYSHSLRAIRFIEKFDKREKVKPFVFIARKS